jgi:PD-(D/E)XK nuclease superfamily
MTENAIAKEIVDAAFRIHTALGPGLLESVYDAVLAFELGRRGLRTTRQQPIPVIYESIRIDTGFRADLVGRGQGDRRSEIGRTARPGSQETTPHVPAARG